MALSYELLSEFAKITNDKKEDKKKDNVYGEVVKQGNETYVRIDGSEQLTPVERTVAVKNKDRVMVTIENHQATIIGNTSDPSYSSSSGNANANKILEVDTIISHNITADNIEAINGYFEKIYAVLGQYDNLEAIYAEIEQLKAQYINVDHLNAKDIEAINAKIESIKADMINAGSIKADDINAINGHFQQLQAYNADFVYVSAEVLEAMMAKIKMLDVESLQAQFAKIDFANITEAAIQKLKADFVDINFANIDIAEITNLLAKVAEIDTAKIDQAIIENLNSKYVNLDFANIGEAAIEKIFAGSGIIKDLITQDGHITGELVGVTIKGDLIETGTIVADKLVVRGQNGLFYKLNLEGLGQDVLEQITNDDFGGDGTVFQDGLHGSTIIAHTITADRINVSDLVAFNATIGGFNISENSIYSGVKNSVDNTTKGLYMDKEGQFAIGDGVQYLKYFKDVDGNYKLEITADSILFKTTGKTITETIANINKEIEENSKELKTSINTTKIYYSKSDNPTTAPSDGWSMSTPLWENGKYIWSRTDIVYNNGDIEEGTPVCITGNIGPKGDNGQGIKKIIDQYYLSDSSMSCVGGSWNESMPEWNKGKWIWMRQKIIWIYDADLYISYDPSDYNYPLKEESDGGYINTNQQKNNTTSEGDFIFTATKDVSIKLYGNQDSEYNFDYLIFNGISHKGENGELKEQIINLSKGTTRMHAYYLKDSSQSNGTDTVKFYFNLNGINAGTEIITYTTPYKADALNKANENIYEIDLQVNKRIVNIENYYAQWTSPTEISNTIDWYNTRQPLNTGYVYWTKTKILYNDGSYKYTSPICLSYIISDTSLTISDIVMQYNLSTSYNNLSNDTWYDVQPILEDDKYLWKREKITLSDGSIKYSDPICIGIVNYTINNNLSDIERTLDSTFGTTRDGWEMTFKGIINNMNSIENFDRYIRFNNGTIELGDKDKPIRLKIENDIIGFYQGDSQVAYISDNTMKISRAEIGNQLDLGNFTFVPGKKGNLTFKRKG